MTKETAADPRVSGAPRRPGLTASLIPAALLSLSAFFLFALEWRPVGYVVMALAVGLCIWLDRILLRDLLLAAVGLIIVSTINVRADVSWGNVVLMGTVLSLAVAVPYLLSRFGYGDHTIRFRWLSGPWTRWMWAYLLAVPLIGWIILPTYFVRSGAYQNWPMLADASEVARFFVGVNFVGSWDEFFFICTIFVLFRRHFSFWIANALTAVIFVSFLWELGYKEWGPLLTTPFAMLQAYLFARTRSLLYVLVVHLLFDVVVFLAIVHVRYPWLQIFFYLW